MHEGVVASDVPLGYDQIALDSLWAFRYWRKRAVRNGFGPFGENIKRGLLPLNIEYALHGRPSNSRAETPLPGLRMGRQVRFRVEDVLHVTRLQVA